MLQKHQLVEHLAALGLRQGDTVMLHSSLSALGPVEGGAATVVDALLAAIGSEGTLMAPAFRASVWGDLRDFTNSDCDCTSADRLCPSRQPGFEGVISREVLNRPGILRSCHKTHSWVALGPAARRLLEGHRSSLTPCGPGNPFEPLVELDGCVVILGVGVNTITLWHYYEEILQVPYVGHYWPREKHLNHTVPGLRLNYEFPGILGDVCKAAGILKTGMVGKGLSGILRARDFESFMATAMADDPYCLVLRPASRDRGDLALDALAKATRMLEAWQRGPRRPEKKFDIPFGPVKAAGPGDVVREDCPAFAGYHVAGEEQVPLCRANFHHPDYFRLGGVFNEWGLTTCGACSWNERFPK